MRIRDLRPLVAAEAFAIVNLGFLAVDVWLAHSTNRFERPVEWLPVGFSIAAPLLLLIRARIVGFLVGWTSVLVGVAGMVFHLQSHFFEEQTIRNLVYTAPFIAPLAYTGIGLLLILDRMVDADSVEWAQWVVFLALGGFAGNFVLSLADHAQNGFFNRAEWVPVVAAAAGVGFLLLAALRPADALLRRVTLWLLAAEILIGMAGFLLHLRADFARPGESLFSRLLYGAPVFAPLLFANLSLLAGIGMWGMVLSCSHGHHSPNRPEARERREEHHSRRSSRDIS